MRYVIRDLPRRLMVINAHPRIGANPAQLSGARRQNTISLIHITALSYKEQGYDKEKVAEAEKLAKTMEELGRLNDEYEQKFGFKFIVWVAGRPKGARQSEVCIS